MRVGTQMLLLSMPSMLKVCTHATGMKGERAKNAACSGKAPADSAAMVAAACAEATVSSS